MSWEREVLRMATYNGDLGCEWRDYVCGGVGCAGSTEESTRGGYIQCVLDYLDALPYQILVLLDNVSKGGIEFASVDAEMLYEIAKYATRAANCDSELLAELAGNQFDDLLGCNA